MNYKISIIALFILLIACKEEKVGLTLEKEKLVAIIADLHLAEEMVGKFRQEEKDSVRTRYLSDISEIHQVDTSMIFSEIKIIQDNPELGLDVYTDVYAQLEAHSKTYDKSKTKKGTDMGKEKEVDIKVDTVELGDLKTVEDKPLVKDKKNGK